MSEVVELKMDELTILKMRKLMKMLLTEKERRF
jgi:hypothetical protein